MVSIALVDARKTSLTGVQNSKKIGSPLRGSDIAASRLMDDAPHRRWLKFPLPWKKLDPPLDTPLPPPLGRFAPSQISHPKTVNSLIKLVSGQQRLYRHY